MRCDVLPHGTAWHDVAAPAAWDAATAPRLTMRIVTGTERGSADGPLATRFDLYAEAAPPHGAKRQRSGAAGGKEWCVPVRISRHACACADQRDIHSAIRQQAHALL